MEINLFINYYVDKRRDRHREIVACFVNNINNIQIDRVVVFCNKRDVDNLNLVLKGNDFCDKQIEKVVFCDFEGRPTYNELFTKSSEYPNDINIIANTDITFESTGLDRLRSWNWKGYCIALTRWDYITRSMDSKIVKHYNRNDSQDCWIVKGRFKQIPEANFPLGKKGCDNRIAFLLSKYYQVINPSQTIRTFHFHLTNIRNYAPHGEEEDLIKPPYKMLKPMKLPR